MKSKEELTEELAEQMADEEEEGGIARYNDSANGIELVVYSKNFNLANLDKEFKIADFERKTYRERVIELSNVILDGKLFDNILTVMPRESEDEPYEVIDGQNRLLAIKYLYENKKIDSFIFAIRILHGENAREAYRAINSGKPLNINDIIKSYDDGNLQFFNRLSEKCAHYTTTDRLTYASVAFAYFYADPDNPKRNKSKFLKRQEVIDHALKMSILKATAVDSCLTLMKKAIGNVMDSKMMIFRIPVFWNLLRIYFERYHRISTGHEEDEFIALVRRVCADKFILDAFHEIKHVALIKIYNRLIQIINE